MWNEKKLSPRFTTSQLPALPPIIPSPRQQYTSPNKSHGSTWELETHAPQPTGGGRFDGTRFTQLESRVGMLEQANRALLEELVQIQAEMEKKQLHQEEAADIYCREMERMKHSLESKVDDLEHRVLQNERNIDHGQNAVSALVRSSQEVEKGVLSSQVEMFSRKDQFLVHLEHVKDDLHRLDQKYLKLQETTSHEQSNMVEVIRKIRGEIRTAENESSFSNLRQHIKRLELEQESLGEGLVRVEAAIGRLENTDVQLRRQLDSKVSDLGAGFIELRGLMTHLENERKRQEVWLKESFSHIQEQMSWLSQKMANSLQSLSTELEKKGNHMATECAQLAGRLNTALEENNRETWENTQKARDLFEMQIGGLEKALHSEHEARCDREAEISHKMSTQWGEVQAKVTEQINELKTTMEREGRGMQQSLAALNGSISLMEREGKLDKEDLSNVLNAEIKTRQEEVVGLQEQISQVQEVCHESLGALREALLSLDERVATDGKELTSSQVQLLQQKLTVEWQEMGRRMLSDVSARMSALHEHIDTASTDTSSKEQPEKQPPEVADVQLHQLLEQQQQWQTVVNGQMSALQRQLQHNSNHVHQMTTNMHEMRLKLLDQIQQETNERFHSVHSLKNQIVNLQTLIPPHYSQQPARYLQPSQGGVTMIPRLEVMEQLQHRSRQRTGTEHSYPSSMPLLQGTSKSSGRYFDPKTGNHPYQEYISDDESQEEEEENASESEDSIEEDIPRDHLETSLASESDEEYGQDVPREQFETSPEPRSVHSSVSDQYLKRSKMPPARVKASQRYRTHHPPLSEYFENAETQGTFTSAAPTPDNLKQVLLRPQSGADTGGEQDERLQGGDPSPSLEGPPEFEEDQHAESEGQSMGEATSLHGHHVDGVRDDGNHVDGVRDDGNHVDGVRDDGVVDNVTDDGNQRQVVENLRSGGGAEESVMDDAVPLVTGTNKQDNTQT